MNVDPVARVRLHVLLRLVLLLQLLQLTVVSHVNANPAASLHNVTSSSPSSSPTHSPSTSAYVDQLLAEAAHCEERRDWACAVLKFASLADAHQGKNGTTFAQLANAWWNAHALEPALLFMRQAIAVEPNAVNHRVSYAR